VEQKFEIKTYFKNPGSKVKGQVVIYLMFFFVVLLAIMGRQLSMRWTADIDALEAQKAELIAFYLAQAGIEQAKVELRDNSAYWPFSGSYPPINGNVPTGTFSEDIYYVSPTQRRIVSTGTPYSAFTGISGVSKRIEVIIDGVGTAPTGDDTVVSLSWKEL